MRIPESVYQLSEYDVSKASWAPQRVAAFDQTTESILEIVHDFGPVPADRIFVLTAAAQHALAGTGQLALLQTIRIVESDLQLVTEIAFNRNATNGTFSSQNFSGEVVLMPGEVLRFSSQFDALTLANTLRSGFTGFLLARGNYQRGSLPLA